MTKNRSTKSALISAVLVLCLCVTMLVGTTFAWFTDSVSSNGNIIKAGNLDVEMFYAQGTEDPSAATWADASQGAIFQNTNIEPGFAIAKHVKVSNVGSLALKYNVTIVPNGEVSDLADVIDVYAISPAQQVPERGSAISDENYVGTLTDVLATALIPTGTLLAGEDYTITFVLRMQESAGNEYMGKSIGTDFTVLLVATQVDYEEDSFGSDYDKDLGLPVVTIPVARPSVDAVTDVVLKASGEDAAEVALPKSVVDALPENVTSLGLNHTAPRVDADNKTVTFDNIDIVDQNGNVIDLANIDLVDNIIMTIPVGGAFAEGDTVTVYHDGEIVASAVVDAEGNITYSVGHLCEVVVTKTEAIVPEAPAEGEEKGVYVIKTAAQLIAFAQSVNAGNTFAGETVVLGADIDLKGINWTPIGNWDNPFKGNFDGKGYTVSNLTINDLTLVEAGLFGTAIDANVTGITVKNVNIRAYSEIGAVVAVPYTGCTVSNCHVTGTVNIYGEWAYVGGVIGHGYVDVDNCSIVADGTGTITSATRNAVGGIAAWIWEGKTTNNNGITNCTVKNLDLTGWTNIGSVTGFIHFNNIIDGCVVENVNIVKTRLDGNPAIGYLAGGYSNGGTVVTLTNNTLTNITITGNGLKNEGANVLYGAEYGGASPVENYFVIENNALTGCNAYITEVVAVKTGDALIAATKDSEVKHIVLSGDITMIATQSNGYGKTGIVIDGKILDGNGYTLRVTNAGATWDSAIAAKSGTIQNITVSGPMRGIFMPGANGDVYIKDVTLTGVIYTFNSDAGNKDYGVYVSDTTLSGWTSFSNAHKEVIFTDCTFNKGSGYQFCRPYNDPSIFVNCTFAEGFEFDTKNAKTITFTDCYYGDTLITAENATTLGNGTTTFLYNGIGNLKVENN